VAEAPVLNQLLVTISQAVLLAEFNARSQGAADGQINFVGESIQCHGVSSRVGELERTGAGAGVREDLVGAGGERTADRRQRERLLFSVTFAIDETKSFVFPPGRRGTGQIDIEHRVVAQDQISVNSQRPAVSVPPGARATRLVTLVAFGDGAAARQGGNSNVARRGVAAVAC